MVRRHADIETPGKRHPGRKLTESEFVAWCDEDTRAEWVDGEIFLMAPDNTYHNRIAGLIYKVMDEYAIENKLGIAFFESIQLRLAGQKRRRQPDIVFVSTAREQIIKDTYIDGAPDLIVEVVSPDSTSRDYREKFIEYEAAGVREYWIVDPLSKHVEAFALGKEKHFIQLPEKSGKVSSKSLPGFFLKPEWLWSEPLPTVFKLLKEMGVKL